MFFLHLASILTLILTLALSSTTTSTSHKTTTPTTTTTTTSTTPPPSTSPNAPHQNCTDLTTLTPTCYATLLTSLYLQNWNQTYRPETCAPYEQWSTCFLATALQNTTFPNQPTQSYNCTLLNSTTPSPDTPNSCPLPLPNDRPWDPKVFYAVYNVYAVQHHISVWATALSSPSAQNAIAALLTSTTSSTTTVTTTPATDATTTLLLTTLIQKYGTDGPADAALVTLLKSTTPIRPTPQIVGGAGTKALSAAQWQPLLRERLAVLLRGALESAFEEWFGMVEGGAYSSYGLSGVQGLEGRLKGV